VNGAMSRADHPAPEPDEMPLWTFAVSLYAAPDVAAACLGLQDRHGCDVNVLLFAAWMGAVRHRTLTPAELAEAAAAVRDWHTEIVDPLRYVRRRLKSGPAPAPDQASEALRTRIKAIEIEAERIELAVLEKRAAKWHSGAPGDDGASLENLKTAVRQFGRDAPTSDALDLVRTIGKGITRMAWDAGSAA
jgi:uncharacterized protein (TIGR02444 family)